MSEGYCILCGEMSDEPGASALCAYHRDFISDLEEEENHE